MIATRNTVIVQKQAEITNMMQLQHKGLRTPEQCVYRERRAGETFRIDDDMREFENNAVLLFEGLEIERTHYDRDLLVLTFSYEQWRERKVKELTTSVERRNKWK